MKLFKRVALAIISTVLAASMLTACSEDDVKESSSKKEESSSTVDVNQQLADANAVAKTVFTAASNYGQKCVSAGYRVPEGVYEFTIVATSDVSEMLVPTKPEDVDLQLAVSVCMESDYVGTKCKVEVNSSGFASGVLWYESDGSTIIGGYPGEATEPGWTLDKAHIQ